MSKTDTEISVIAVQYDTYCTWMSKGPQGTQEATPSPALSCGQQPAGDSGAGSWRDSVGEKLCRPQRQAVPVGKVPGGREI